MSSKGSIGRIKNTWLWRRGLTHVPSGKPGAVQIDVRDKVGEGEPVSEQMNLLPEGAPEKYLEVIKQHNSFKSLFDDVKEAKIITFVSSPEYIKSLFDEIGFDSLEIIAGDSSDADFRKGLYEKEGLADELERLKQDGRLRIYVLNKKITIHMKVYILKTNSGGFRLISGSPNFTKNAWATNQREAITVFEGDTNSEAYKAFDRVWNDQVKDCKLFLEDLTKQIERSEEPREKVIHFWVSGADLSSVSDDTREITADIVRALKPPEDDWDRLTSEDVLDISDSEEVISLRAYDHEFQQKTRNEITKAPNIHFNSQTNSLVGSRSAWAAQYRQLYGIPIMTVTGGRLFFLDSRGRAHLFSKPLPEDPNAVREGIQHIEDYLNTVDSYASCDVPKLTKMHMFEALLFIFWAPLVGPYAHQLQLAGINLDKNVPFLYIHGESGGGKSTFLRFALRLISGQYVREPEDASNVDKRKLEGITRSSTCFPFMIDDISKGKIDTSFKDVLVNYWNDWEWEKPYPAIVFSSNDSKPNKPFRNRAKMLEFNLLFDNQKIYQAKCTQLLEQDNELFKWFAHRFFKRLEEDPSSVTEKDDLLSLCRQVFRDLYDYANKPIPDFFPEKPAEELHDPGRDLWKDLEKKGHLKFRRSDGNIVANFGDEFEHYHILRYERELHESIRSDVQGKTVIIKNPEYFRKWYGDFEKQPFWKMIFG